MSLKDILQKIVDTKEPIWLCDKDRDWDASDLLITLSEAMLKLNAHFQPGMYIAEMNQGGYLGRVLYRVKARG